MAYAQARKVLVRQPGDEGWAGMRTCGPEAPIPGLGAGTLTRGIHGPCNVGTRRHASRAKVTGSFGVMVRVSPVAQVSRRHA